MSRRFVVSENATASRADVYAKHRMQPTEGLLDVFFYCSWIISSYRFGGMGCTCGKKT
jgi:hypothetical protein